MVYQQNKSIDKLLLYTTRDLQVLTLTWVPLPLEWQVRGIKSRFNVWKKFIKRWIGWARVVTISDYLYDILAPGACICKLLMKRDMQHFNGKSSMIFIVSDIKLLANNMHTVYFYKHSMHGWLKYISNNMAAMGYPSDSSDLRKYMLTCWLDGYICHTPCPEINSLHICPKG